MKDKFIALIGVGYWGKNILRNLVSLNVLIGCFDTNEDEVANISKSYPSIKIFKSLEQLLNDKLLFFR